MDILEKIVRCKQAEVAAMREIAEREDWPKKAQETPPGADFDAAIRARGRIRVIAEIKQASPSAGVLRSPFDPCAIAETYARNGADAISVLTDSEFFRGSIDDLASVHKNIPLPLLRKDFVIDPIQIYQAKIAGASAVLLIAECLQPKRLAELVLLAQSIGLATLVELHEPENLDAVLDSGTKVIGVNNRDLRTFETRLDHTLSLVDRIPNDRLLVSESGIRNREDVLLLRQSGVHAILVGESLMRASDPGAKLAELLA